MDETIQTSKNEVKVNASGLSMTYDGKQWIRKDAYNRANQCVLDEQAVVRELKNEVEYLRNLLNEAGVHWKVGGGGQ